MKGNNDVGLNRATMIEAVQHYFDTVLFAKGRSPKVISVEVEKQGYTAGTHFVVKVTDPDVVAQPAQAAKEQP